MTPHRGERDRSPDHRPSDLLAQGQLFGVAEPVDHRLVRLQCLLAAFQLPQRAPSVEHGHTDEAEGVDFRRLVQEGAYSLVDLKGLGASFRKTSKSTSSDEERVRILSVYAEYLVDERERFLRPAVQIREVRRDDSGSHVAAALARFPLELGKPFEPLVLAAAAEECVQVRVPDLSFAGHVDAPVLR
jgi:hypothetical protein